MNRIRIHHLYLAILVNGCKYRLVKGHVVYRCDRRNEIDVASEFDGRMNDWVIIKRLVNVFVERENIIKDVYGDLISRVHVAEGSIKR